MIFATLGNFSKNKKRTKNTLKRLQILAGSRYFIIYSNIRIKNGSDSFKMIKKINSLNDSFLFKFSVFMNYSKKKTGYYRPDTY